MKKILQRRLHASGSVRYDALVLTRKIMSEAWILTAAFGYVAMYSKIGIWFSHLVLWGRFLLTLCIMGLSTCCLPALHNIRNFLLCVCFVLLTPLAVLETYRSVSFSEHLDHMSFLILDMAYASGISVTLWLNRCRSYFTYSGNGMSTYCFV